MSSLYLNKLLPEERHSLIKTLHASQQGNCFICEKPIDLQIHAQSIDIDHVEPLKVGGKDGPENFAITHASCNRSKQASDLRVARVLARFERIRAHCEEENRGPNLADILTVYGGAKHELAFEVSDGKVRYSFDATGDPGIREVPVYNDKLSALRYFFLELPISTSITTIGLILATSAGRSTASSRSSTAVVRSCMSRWRG